jgi:hypothetical protein
VTRRRWIAWTKAKELGQALDVELGNGGEVEGAVDELDSGGISKALTMSAVTVAGRAALR